MSFELLKQFRLHYFGYAFMLLVFVSCGQGTAGPTPEPLPTSTPLADHRVAEYFPKFRPSASLGRPLYVPNCAVCHGLQGKGDAPEARLMDPKPTDFTDLRYARQATPGNSFRAVTRGVLGSAMIGFDLALSEEQRWNIVFYERSLGTNAERIAQGGIVYREKCAACHGTAGQGDGPEAAKLSRRPANFTDAQFMSGLSSQDLFQAMTHGTENQPEHVFTDLSEDDRWAVADFVWTFIYEP